MSIICKAVVRAPVETQSDVEGTLRFSVILVENAHRMVFFSLRKRQPEPRYQSSLLSVPVSGPRCERLRVMNWQEQYPEGSVAIIDGERFDLWHNPHGLGIDLHRLSDSKLAMRVAPEYVPQVVDSIKSPD